MEDKYEQDKREISHLPPVRGKLKCRDHLARKSSRGRKTNTDSGDMSFMKIKMPEPDLEGFSLAISFSYDLRKGSKRESFGTEGE